MKIGITCYPTYGGSGTVATELGRSLARLGHQVHFITTALPYRLTEFVENIYFHEVEVLNYPLFEYVPYSLSLATKMAQVACREELDLLHVHYAIPHATSAYLARNVVAETRRLPIITTLHGTDITLVGRDPSYFDITRFSIMQSDGVTAVSEYLKTQTIERFHVTVPIEVIPNFVDTNEFRPLNGRDRDCLRHDGERILMHISNFRPVKRISDIVDVFAGVARRIDARLILIGEGPEKDRIQAQVDRLGLRDRVSFLGRQNNVNELIPCADIYLQPSEFESFGLTALEAMSCGVPVIGTSGHGMDEFLGDGAAGALYPVGDVGAMIEGCLAILTDRERAANMGEAGRSRVIDRYHVDDVVGRYEDLYRRMIGAG